MLHDVLYFNPEAISTVCDRLAPHSRPFSAVYTPWLAHF